MTYDIATIVRDGEKQIITWNKKIKLINQLIL